MDNGGAPGVDGVTIEQISDDDPLIFVEQPQGDRIASDMEAALTKDIEYMRHVSVHYHPAHALGSGELGIHC